MFAAPAVLVLAWLPACGSVTIESQGSGGALCVPEDDGNPCTLDVCDGQEPIHSPAPAGAPCGAGGLVCDGEGACVACLAASDCPGASGACQAATCSAGVCGVAPAPDGASCDDGEPCTKGEKCQAGACAGGAPLVCAGGATCVAGACAAPACSGEIGFPGPALEALGERPLAITTGDLDGDGTPDLAVRGHQHLSVLLNHGDGTFAPKVDYPSLVGFYTVSGFTAVDLNGDGALDLVAGYNHWVNVWLNQGSGTFPSLVSTTRVRPSSPWQWPT